MIRWCKLPEIWCLTDVIIFHSGPVFGPRNIPKNQNFEKWKKNAGDTIILHMCTKNYDQMMYSSWDMVRDRCSYFSFWAIFCPFTPVTAQKIKILEKWRNRLEISSFYIRVPKFMIRSCTVPEIYWATDGRTDGKSDIKRWVPHLKISMRLYD